MAILQAILAAIANSAGRLLNTLVGWATVILFGKVPSERQTYMSVIAFGSLLWLASIVGTISPKAGGYLMIFVSVHEKNSQWVRLGMGIGIVLLPPICGAVSLLLVDKADRPKTWKGIAGQVLRGYSFCIANALALVCMIVVAPWLKVRAIARRATTAHVPVVIEPDDYASVVEDTRRVLANAGFDPKVVPASKLITGPTKLVTLFGGAHVKRLVADKLSELHAGELEVLVHPSDIVITAPKKTLARAQAALAEGLAFTNAYLTWDKEANAIEDEIRSVHRALARDGIALAALDARLHDVDSKLRRIALPYEEWEVLFRQELLAARELDDAMLRARHRRAA